MVETGRLISSSLSDVGRTRSENQDACGEFRNALGERLLVVADGMGGHAGGATASKLSVETVGRVFEGGQGTPNERLRLGLEEANRAVYQAAEADPELRGMGSTCVALLFGPDGSVGLGWVGDSRAYRFRRGQLEQLSDDHSLVAEWVRMGRISAEEAESHPRRNEVLRALGPEPSVQVDVRSFQIEPGDIYLLCSDGLCGYLSNERISAIIGVERPEDAVRQLVETVNVEKNSPDNVTVQIVAVPADFAIPAVTSPGSTGKLTARDSKEVNDMGDTGGNFDNAGSSRNKKLLVVAIALLTVAAVVVGATWYTRNAKLAEQEAMARTDAQRQAELLAEEQEAERAKRQAELEIALAAELEAQAAKEEAARLEAVRLADLALAESEAREMELAREITEAREALEREQAAARLAAEEEAAARAAILAEQERRRQEAIAVEEARAIEIAFNMAREVDAFVSDWTRALVQGDYSLYRQLGFRETESEFHRLYGDDQAKYQISVFEKKQWEGGFVALRVTETYDPPGSGPGLESRKTERRLVLRPTAKGMRFAGDRL